LLGKVGAEAWEKRERVINRKDLIFIKMLSIIAPMSHSRSWVRDLNQFWYPEFPKKAIEEDNTLFWWTLDPIYPLLGMLFYLASKPILKQICKTWGLNGKSQTMKWFVVAHSAILSVFSAYIVFHSYYAVWKTYTENGFMKMYCNHDNLLWNNGLGYCAILFYLSKVYEYMDTWILIIKGKEVSVLQAFHHAIAVPCIWSVTVSQSPGLVAFICFNALIHTFMYCYYAFAALGYRSKLKRLITTGQIVQFFVGIIYCTPMQLMETCTTPAQRYSTCFVCIVAGVLILLFANFFIQEYYIKKNGCSKQNGHAKQNGHSKQKAL